ncbi:hypothetical protein TWF696_006751 [Orbilia brochopaga]|uniref:Uncharacterized protein n=1 Tax=Orbilia brochopaga TaxID=3140254 RepID=A0AAV9UPN8_9PEZI
MRHHLEIQKNTDTHMSTTALSQTTCSMGFSKQSFCAPHRRRDVQFRCIWPWATWAEQAISWNTGTLIPYSVRENHLTVQALSILQPPTQVIQPRNAVAPKQRKRQVQEESAF